jgi:hypothetical protein
VSHTLLPLAISALILSGCTTLSTLGRQELMKQTDSWHKMIRWGEYDAACTQFAAAEVQQQCRNWFPGRGFSVIEQTVQDVAWDDSGDGATITVAIDYVRPPSATLKRVVLRQRWESRDRRWQLTGPPPEFP